MTLREVNLKPRKFLLNILLSVFAILQSPVFAETGDVAEQAYSEQCLISSVFNDPEEMAKTVSDPVKFKQLVTVMSNPTTAQGVMGCSNSMQINVLMTNVTNPTKMMNAMAIFTNPTVYMNWMVASMNPQTYQPFFAFMNPLYYMQWMSASMNPGFDSFSTLKEVTPN